MARALGQHSIVLLRGHGAVVVGESVRQCVRHAVIAETNARQQIEGTILGPVRFLTASEIAYARRQKPKDADRAWRHWKRQAKAL
jgi:HCOMODA/2-hydroxy-3-carboxy-muconic semialdehyde decarboxylase